LARENASLYDRAHKSPLARARTRLPYPAKYYVSLSPEQLGRMQV
jgi:hypothetical protein